MCHGRAVGDEPGQLDLGGHVRELELDRLEGGYGPPEGRPLLGIGQRGVEAGLSEAD